jgi:hypothetical protein
VDATLAEAAETFNVIVFFKDFRFSKSTAVRGHAEHDAAVSSCLELCLNVDRKKLHDRSYRVSSTECQAKYVSRIGVLVRCTLKEIQKLTKEKAYEN